MRSHHMAPVSRSGAKRGSATKPVDRMERHRFSDERQVETHKAQAVSSPRRLRAPSRVGSASGHRNGTQAAAPPGSRTPTCSDLRRRRRRRTFDCRTAAAACRRPRRVPLLSVRAARLRGQRRIRVFLAPPPLLEPLASTCKDNGQFFLHCTRVNMLHIYRRAHSHASAARARVGRFQLTAREQRGLRLPLALRTR